VTTAEERLMILHMVEEGKISAEEGARLIAALGGPERSAPAAPGRPGGERHLRIVVSDTLSSRARVDVRFPTRLFDAAMRLGARFVPEDRLADLEAVADAVRAGQTGRVLDVLDRDGEHHVEVYVE
jgi:hypothetical protein